MLHLPAKIRFLIGEERATCHWSKLKDARERTKLHHSLGKQQLEFWTRQVVHIETAANLCTSQPDFKRPLKSGNVSVSLAIIIQEKEFIIAKAWKQNSLFPLGPGIECLLQTFDKDYKISVNMQI